MAAAKTKGPLVDPALCRCCRNIKKCRLLTAEYEWSGTKEVYSDMFMDCFGLLFSDLDGEKRDACICATCVVRLRDACAFRAQVLRAEQAFVEAKIEGATKLEVEVKLEPGEAEAEAEAGATSDADSAAADHDDDDYSQPDLPDLKPDQTSSPHQAISLRTRSRARQKTAVKSKGSKGKVGKQDLLNKMQRLKHQLDRMLKAPAKTAVKKGSKTEPNRALRKSTEKIKPPKMIKMAPSEPDQQDMMYRNAIIMVLNSYLCPFLNRISNYYCYYCRDQFMNPAELREHTLTHDPVAFFECSMENKRIPKCDITRIDCRLCSEKISDLPTLRSHLSSVHSLKIYPVTNEFLAFKLTATDIVECAECGSTFPYFDLLKKHMIDHFGTYICDQCGACFLEPTSLRTHIKSHSRVESFFPCEICGKNLRSKYSRYLHITTVHEKKPTVNCYKCGDSFLSYALRNRHLIEVHGDKRTFSCKQCDKVYNRRKTLMEHMRRNHLKVYRHQCDLCDQRFYLPSRLKEHMATHTGERNFRCEFCDKSYPRLQSLQEHTRSHGAAAERRYKKTADQDFHIDTAY